VRVPACVHSLPVHSRPPAVSRKKKKEKKISQCLAVSAVPSTGPRRLHLLFDRPLPLPRPPRVRMPRSAASPLPPPRVRSGTDAGFRSPPRSPTRCPMESSICGRPFRGRHASRTTASRLLCLTRFGARLLGSSASLPSYPARSLALARAIPRSPLPHRLPRCCQPSLHPHSASRWASPLLLRFRGRSRGCLGDLLPPASTSRPHMIHANHRKWREWSLDAFSRGGIHLDDMHSATYGGLSMLLQQCARDPHGHAPQPRYYLDQHEAEAPLCA
jgi:hypothetical protein